MKKNSVFSLADIYFILQGLMLCCLSYNCTAYSAEREYVVPMADSQWLSEGKKNYECTLSQPIPFYGEGKFIRKSGHNVVFKLFSDEPVLKQDARVIIQSEPPQWRHDDKVFEIGQFNFQQGHNPLDVTSPQASRMFQQIENGMSPVVIYRDLADGRDIIAVMLSPINFRAALKDYRECEKSLMDFDIEEIKNLRLYFATNKATLTEKSKRDLNNVVRYLAMDPSIKQIKIDAHADARGRRRFNDKLSEERSDTVLNYLLSIGVKKDMLYAIAHGERNPFFDNKNATGRAKNRRADVQLLTTPPPTQEEREALEKERLQERRNQLTERSIFNKVPEIIKQSKEQPDSDEQAPISNDISESGESESGSLDEPLEPGDDEPPAPNFINFDHLVDKNNQKVPGK